MVKSILLAAVYGTLVGGNLVKAPKVVGVDGYWRASFAITESQANALGYKLVVETPPVCPANHHAVAIGWMDGERISRVYDVRRDPEPVYRYSKLKLIVAAKAQGKWERVKAFIKSADLEDEWLACQYFEDGNSLFVAGTNAVITSGVATDAEVRALLEASRD